MRDPSRLHFDSYWDEIKYSASIFDVKLWVEFIRQWLVILATIVLSIIFVVSIRNLKRTQHGLDLDQLVLIAELIKVSSFKLPLTVLLLCR